MTTILVISTAVLFLFSCLLAYWVIQLRDDVKAGLKREEDYAAICDGYKKMIDESMAKREALANDINALWEQTVGREQKRYYNLGVSDGRILEKSDAAQKQKES